MDRSLSPVFKLLTFVERSMVEPNYFAGLTRFANEFARHFPALPWAFVLLSDDPVAIGSGNVAALGEQAAHRLARLAPNLAKVLPATIEAGAAPQAPLIAVDEIALLPMMHEGQVLGAVVRPERVDAEAHSVYECLERCQKMLFLHFRVLEQCSEREPQTGLLHREAFLKRLGQAASLNVRHAMGFCVGVLDLDGFKVINDTHGHPVGDEVLAAVAKFLSETIREGDTCARIGGDEFAVLLPFANASAGQFFGKRILRDLAALAVPPVERIAASLGVLCVPGGAQADPREIMIQADRALYRVKAAGGDGLEMQPWQAS